MRDSVPKTPKRVERAEDVWLRPSPKPRPPSPPLETTDPLNLEERLHYQHTLLHHQHALQNELLSTVLPRILSYLLRQTNIIQGTMQVNVMIS